MLTGPYFKPFLGILRLSGLSFALPFRWNEKKKKVDLTNSATYTVVMYSILFVTTVYVLVLSLQILRDFSQLTPEVGMILVMWLVINVGSVYTKASIIWYESEMLDFINSWIAYEKDYFAGEDTKKKKKVDPSVMLVLKLVDTSMVTFPLAVASYVALQPCSPPFITSYILQCNASSELGGASQVARFVLVILEGMFWFNIVGMAAFVICFFMYLPQKCLFSYISDLQLQWNHSIQPCQENRLFYQGILFREVQLLHNQLHEILRFAILPMGQTTWMFITIIALYTTIKLHDVIEFPIFLFFPLCAIDGCVFFYVVIGANSQTYSRSKELVDVTWKIRKSGRGTKWMRRFSKSSKELRTYVGTIGFLDKTTPIAIIHFCLAQTGGLLLLEG